MAGCSPQPVEDTSAWRGELDLTFAQAGGRTVLARRRHLGPLQVQRPFYPEGGVCHVYVLHPPGGVVGGDRLAIDVHALDAGHALVTTPAAGKFYRSGGATAVQRQRLRVAPGASLEWLPQENILYGGARVDMSTRVEVSPGARFLGWDMLCLGLPASGDGFSHGLARQGLEIWCEDSPLFIERAYYEGGSNAMSSPWGLRGHPVVGTVACLADEPGLDRALRDALPQPDGDALLAVTQIDNVVVCRYLGDHAEQARECFVRAWEVLRPRVMERPACRPRIWST
jgi:urease accessory protein